MRYKGVVRVMGAFSLANRFGYVGRLDYPIIEVHLDVLGPQSFCGGETFFRCGPHCK